VKGILFKPDMVKAIAKGRKTVTRRVMNPQPIVYDISDTIQGLSFKGMNMGSLTRDDRVSIAEETLARYARYRVGETVYVKEAWRSWCVEGEWHVRYRLDNAIVIPNVSADEETDDYYFAEHDKWDSPLFMPEWAARHFITITGVRAERVQEITEEDVVKEGVRYPVTQEGNRALRITGKHPPSDYIPKGCFDGLAYAGTNEVWLKAHFASLWDTINPKHSWDSNPWVWVYEFQLKEGGHASTG